MVVQRRLTRAKLFGIGLRGAALVFARVGLFLGLPVQL